MIPYLLLADIQNTALSAALVFSERILYPTYLTVPRLWGISALDDQASRRGHNVGAWFARLSCASGIAGDAAPERTTDRSPGHHTPLPPALAETLTDSEEKHFASYQAMSDASGVLDQ